MVDIPRLPPGQNLTGKFPILDLGVQPAIDHKDFRLTASGLIENPIDWGWDDFNAQPQIQLTTDIHCVTTWSRFDNDWAGVSGQHFLSVVKPMAEAKFMIFHSHDGYTTNIPLMTMWSWPTVGMASPSAANTAAPCARLFPNCICGKAPNG